MLTPTSWPVHPEANALLVLLKRVSLSTTGLQSAIIMVNSVNSIGTRGRHKAKPSSAQYVSIREVMTGQRAWRVLAGTAAPCFLPRDKNALVPGGGRSTKQILSPFYCQIRAFKFPGHQAVNGSSIDILEAGSLKSGLHSPDILLDLFLGGKASF